jgi:hypothetical protein
MATVPDFWGEIEPAEVRTPAAMMREQASLLGAKTGYAVEGRVNTETQGASSITHLTSWYQPWITIRTDCFGSIMESACTPSKLRNLRS